MKKIIFILFCINFLSCKKNDSEQKLIYKQFLNYRNELKSNTDAQEMYIISRKKDSSVTYRIIDSLNTGLIKFEKSFKKIKSNEKLKRIQILDSFSNRHKLFLKSDISDYENVTDSVFNSLIEINFYRIKNEYQCRVLLRRGCI